LFNGICGENERRMKKTVQYGKRIVDLDFKKDSIYISIWREADNPSGFEYITEFAVKTRVKHE
jgi:hypothetical protein